MKALATACGKLVLLSALLSVPDGRCLQAASVQPSWDLPPHQQKAGVFWREHWYDRESAGGYTRRLRINAPEVVLHETFGHRPEARENGLMLIRAEEDLFQMTGTELYAELWGGHPGTANKRVTVNGRSTYQLPEVGTEAGHCTFSYPVVSLGRTDLVNGLNAFQWALDQGSTFWGHAMIDAACLRVALTNGHPDLVELGLDDAEILAGAEPLGGEREGWRLRLRVADGELEQRIDSVQFQGWYDGYDENGNLTGRDWHGYTQFGEPVAWIGKAESAPFEVHWDTSMLPAQRNVAVRAVVRFKEAPGICYLTSALTNLEIAHRSGEAVGLVYSADLPPGFWSRAGNKKTCTLDLDIEPARIERAELYVKSWTGGAGEVENYFTLNGHHFPVAEGHAHEAQYHRLPVDPVLLREGDNVIELLSDTTHHGIEILYPGPALMIRYRVP